MNALRMTARGGVKHIAALGALVLAAAGCSSAAKREHLPASSATTPPPAPSPTPSADASSWPPPALGDVVFTMSGHIGAGEETMYCEYAVMPTDRTTAVPSAESHYSAGSHHFLAQRSSLTSLPDAGTSTFTCFPTPVIAGITGSYYEAQQPDAQRTLPPGIAHVFRPGEILLLTAHYLNTTSQPIDAHVTFTLHTIDVKYVKEEAGTFFLLGTHINIPPFSIDKSTQNCPITKDINLALLWSHMHSRGVGFRAWTDDAVATQQAGGDLYATTEWSEPPLKAFPYDPPIIVHAGSSIDFECTYKNATPNTFVFGLSAATAEMCLLHGMYWPRLDSVTEQCQSGTGTAETPLALDGGPLNPPDAGADMEAGN